MSEVRQFSDLTDDEMQIVYDALLRASTDRDGNRQHDAFDLACDIRMAIGDRSFAKSHKTPEPNNSEWSSPS